MRLELWVDQLSIAPALVQLDGWLYCSIIHSVVWVAVICRIQLQVTVACHVVEVSATAYEMSLGDHHHPNCEICYDIPNSRSSAWSIEFGMG